MDEFQARALSADLIGKSIAGWHVRSEINHGKSAVVFRASKGTSEAALKVFAADIIERFGVASQLTRIAREQRLRNHGHPHLVNILDGGKCPDTGHLFVVMEYIDAPTLSSAIPHLPRSRIAPIIAQVASAAKFLADRDIGHRDIKPDNIAVTRDYERAVLLDLGVIKPTADAAITDTTSGREFIATLRYSSPEYLMREEDDDTPTAMSALAFYQLGGVLHDMIMRSPLFSEHSSPWPRLVRAILHTQPHIYAADVTPHLIHVASNALLKDPERRLSAVAWEDFITTPSAVSHFDAARARVVSRAKVPLDTRAEPSPDIETSLSELQITLRNSLRNVSQDPSVFPPITWSLPAPIESIAQLRMCFSASATHHTSTPLTLVVRAKMHSVDPMVADIDIAAALSRARPCTAMPHIWTNLQRGIVDHPALADRLSGILYWALDRAQTSPPLASGHDDPLWLDMKDLGAQING